jgi:hypothetical protein
MGNGGQEGISITTSTDPQIVIGQRLRASLRAKVSRLGIGQDRSYCLGESGGISSCGQRPSFPGLDHFGYSTDGESGARTSARKSFRYGVGKVVLERGSNEEVRRAIGQGEDFVRADYPECMGRKRKSDGLIYPFCSEHGEFEICQVREPREGFAQQVESFAAISHGAISAKQDDPSSGGQAESGTRLGHRGRREDAEI